MDSEKQVSDMFNFRLLIFVPNGIATIKHRCVAHVYGSNSVERLFEL
jgi:hypothetical protein